jgi:hypothetical protein
MAKLHTAKSGQLGGRSKGKTIVYPNPSNDGKVNIVFEDKK